MPLTFIDIERQKNWCIWLLFLFLMLLYFFVTALFAAAFFPLAAFTTSRFWIFSGVSALLVAGIHFWFSVYHSVSGVLKSLNAQPPDPGDDIHTMLMNIMREIHVVTGNRRKMQCVVIPSLSLNALAAADLKGEAVIGITEGLLSRVTRPQLEAVVAHEAHHVLSGDCLETTVATSIFGAFSAVVEKMSGATRGRAFSSPAFLLAWLFLKLSYLLNMFISREREYRADAASVRMTRNPLALAETLHLLSRSWRGAGFIGNGLEMLCIVNPQAMALDETEGFWADLFSTHPPIRMRLDVLLKMARVSVTELDEKAMSRQSGLPGTALPHYYAMSPRQQWEGPFTIAELAAQPWLSQITWVTTGDERPVDRAWKEPVINAIFTERLSGRDQPVSGYACPTCKQPLVTESFEGTQIDQCRFCSGMLVASEKIPRIIARTGRERPCSERVSALAKTVVAGNQRRHAERKLSGGAPAPLPFLSCPKCGNPMHRQFYSQAHLIEIDRCGFCSLTWFEQNELEMLQCIITSRTLEAPVIAEVR